VPLVALHLFLTAEIFGETLIKSTFYGEPAQLCDAGMNKIKGLAPLIVPQTCPHLFNQHFLGYLGVVSVAACGTAYAGVRWSVAKGQFIVKKQICVICERSRGTIALPLFVAKR